MTLILMHILNKFALFNNDILRTKGDSDDSKASNITKLYKNNAHKLGIFLVYSIASIYTIRGKQK